MLRDGLKFVGTVVGRDEVRSDPLAYEWISLLPDGSDELMRFPVEDVEYILFQNGADGVLVEFPKEYELHQPGSTVMVAGKADSKGGAAWMIGAGIALVGVGIFIKFGNEQNPTASGLSDSHEKSHNSMNYAWIGLGSALITAGIIKHMARPEVGYNSGDEFLIGYHCSHGDDGFAVGYRLTF
jgi:hypothetical protein